MRKSYDCTPSFSLLVACLAALGSACGNEPPATDAGTDAPIELPDTGAPVEDAGPPDAGDGLCDDLSALLFGTPPLSPGCLPLCTSETHAAFTACGSDTACAEAALDADATPPVQLRTRYGIYTVGCAARGYYTCVVWQTYSCYEQYCRPSFYAYSDCLDAGRTCTAELMTLQACVDASPDATACVQTRVDACFP